MKLLQNTLLIQQQIPIHQLKAQIAITVTGINDPPEVLYPVQDPNIVVGQPIIIRHKQIFDDPDTGIYDIAEYKIIDPETEAETSLPDGLRLKQNKLPWNH